MDRDRLATNEVGHDIRQEGTDVTHKVSHLLFTGAL